LRDAVSRLLDSGISADAQDGVGWTALMMVGGPRSWRCAVFSGIAGLRRPAS